MRTIQKIAIIAAILCAAMMSLAYTPIPVPLDPSRFVTIHFKGNVDDNTGYGLLTYNYMISKCEVSVAEWAEFYNDPDSRKVGSFNAGYTNWVAASGSGAPAVYMSFHQAAQYCNWLTTGCATSGVYSINSTGVVTGIDRLFRNANGMAYVIPRENEWYKAALFKPDGSGYSDYANGSDTRPEINNPSGFWMDQSTPRAVGIGTVEQNGTLNMMGSIWEWVEDTTGAQRGRGASTANALSGSRRTPASTEQAPYGGFRIAVVPVPTTRLLSEFVTIRSPGNTNDNTGFGGVDDNFMISKHEVSIADWEMFYDDRRCDQVGTMNTNYNYWDTSNRLSKKPAVYISFNQAAQYCNWLTTGHATIGAYAIDSAGAVTNVNRGYRNGDGIVFVLPTEDEWYKAALYKTNSTGYSDYANGSNTRPETNNPTGFWIDQATPRAVDVGTVEQNGTRNMMGCIWEWVEDLGGTQRGRGAAGSTLSGSRRTSPVATEESPYGGFRVVAIPLPKPKFKTVYDNDTTQILSNESPYHRRHDTNCNRFCSGMLYESIEEASAKTGVDIHALQPGFGWVPCWESTNYPYASHTNWLCDRYGAGMSYFYPYDPTQITGEFVNYCKTTGSKAFISLRMNDMHGKHAVELSRDECRYYRNDRKDFRDTTWGLKVSEFYWDHFDCRLNDIYTNYTHEVLLDKIANGAICTDLWEACMYSTNPPRCSAPINIYQYLDQNEQRIRINNSLDWTFSEVPSNKFKFVQEICEKYDIDGFELDFMRSPWYFRTNCPSATRRQIMTDFVKKVRRVLDETAKDGRYRWLSVRLPSLVEGSTNLPFMDNINQRNLGLDVQSLYDAGVDMFNMATEGYLVQQSDLGAVHAAVPEAALYLELTQTPGNFLFYDTNGVLNKAVHLLATTNELYTAAHLAYSRGASGITTYNFPYYREFNSTNLDISSTSALTSEPPFEVFQILRSPALVAQQSQHYFLTLWDAKTVRFSRPLGSFLNQTNWIDMAPPTGGWTQDGRLRIVVTPDFDSRNFCTVYFNGTQLTNTTDISDPYPMNQSPDTNQLCAWTLPRNILSNGLNQIRIVMTTNYNNTGREMQYLDIGIR